MSNTPPPGYGPPPAGYSGATPEPPKRSHVVELLVGPIAGGALLAALTALSLAISASSSNGWPFFIGPVLALLIPLGMLFPTSTRWWGIGMLLGYFLALIVVGGACVLIIASLSGNIG